MTLPQQHVRIDKDGILRFERNSIVRYLLDTHPFADLNHLAGVSHFTDEEREQFAQLIGYSVGGFEELSYVSEETRERLKAVRS